MAKYIICETAYNLARKSVYYSDFRRSMADLTSLKELLEDTPAVDVAEVKHGEWINEGEYLYKCSLCGDKAFLRLGGKPCRYCPSCGAKMKEGI